MTIIYERFLFCVIYFHNLERQRFGLMEVQAINELRNGPNFHNIDVPPTPELLNEEKRVHLISELVSRDVNLRNLPQMYMYAYMLNDT